jgi:hypothetical protein
MFFIDWMSPKNHAEFNKSFFETLQVTNSELCVFEQELILENPKTTYIACSGKRFSRAYKIMKICWKNRSKPIFLMSYDPVLVIFLQLFCKSLFAIEHNTTPEGKLYFKHALWQKLFFWRIMRFAQFPSQYKILKKLGQTCEQLGSPLRAGARKIDENSAPLYLAPSDRMMPEELYKVKNLIEGDEVIIRRSHFSEGELAEIKANVNIMPQAYVDFDGILPALCAIIIAVPSNVRGSGWFNEAIKYGVPLIITNEGMQRVFEETFPGYPYIDPKNVSTKEELQDSLLKLKIFPNVQYISGSNQKLKDKFYALCGNC